MESNINNSYPKEVMQEDKFSIFLGTVLWYPLLTGIVIYECYENTKDKSIKLRSWWRGY